MSSLVTAKAGAFVECPVGGTIGPAKEGKLFGFAGGEAADFARAKPLLDQMCRRVEHLGPAGSGSSMKLAINLPLLVYWQALGEAFSFVKDWIWNPRGHGHPRRHLRRAAMLQNRAPAIAAALAGKEGAGLGQHRHPEEGPDRDDRGGEAARLVGAGDRGRAARLPAPPPPASAARTACRCRCTGAETRRRPRRSGADPI